LSFADEPVWRELVDGQAARIPAVFRKTDLNLSPVAALAVSRSLGEITLSWPVSSPDFDLYSSATLEDAAWRPVLSSPSVVQDRWRISIPTTNHQQYFRLILRAP
ncbi:MAG TPA: hypothetical protein VNU68_03005, partial [Verrucomicrobiae bacterium]|nr:hypothetical protein [Verrucomicrobiae bacterium]